MTRLSTRTLHSPDIGTITAYVDSDDLRIVFEFEISRGTLVECGFTYEDSSELAAKYAQLTDEQILTHVQVAVDEFNGTDGRVLH